MHTFLQISAKSAEILYFCRKVHTSLQKFKSSAEICLYFCRKVHTPLQKSKISAIYAERCTPLCRFCKTLRFLQKVHTFLQNPQWGAKPLRARTQSVLPLLVFKRFLTKAGFAKIDHHNQIRFKKASALHYYRIIIPHCTYRARV